MLSFIRSWIYNLEITKGIASAWGEAKKYTLKHSAVIHPRWHLLAKLHVKHLFYSTCYKSNYPMMRFTIEGLPQSLNSSAAEDRELES